MPEFRSLVLYHGYSSFQFGLFTDQKCIAQDQAEGTASCSEFLPRLTKLFNANNLSLEELDACIAYTGPGSFTALRVTLSFANGFAFARHLPLIGVTGFESLIEQIGQQGKDKYIIQALKAFGEEVYVQITDPKEHVLLQTCIPSKQAESIRDLIPPASPCYFVGNGIPLLLEHLGSSYLRQHPENILDLTTTPTIESIARCGLTKYQAAQYTDNLQPTYLKNPPAHP